METAVKPSDEARSTTLADDSDLSVSLEAGETYVIDMWLNLSTSSAGSAQFQNTFSYTGSLSHARIAVGIHASGDDTSTPDHSSLSTGLSSVTLVLDNGTDNNYYAQGTFTTTSSGTLTFQWGSSTGSTITLRQGGYMTTRVGQGSFSGASGASGFSGTFSGESGFSGIDGIDGIDGDSGYSGTSGFSGTSGYSGTFSGFSGTSGASGVSGYSGELQAFAMFISTAKTVDESVTSSTTLQDDDELQVTLKAGETYRIMSEIFFGSTTSSVAFKFEWDFTGTVDDVRFDSLIWQVTGGFETPIGLLVTSLPSATQTFTLDFSNPEKNSIKTDGTIKVATDGVLKFRWAQAASNPTAMQVFAGSYIEARELSDGAASGISGFSGISGYSGTYSGFSGQSGLSGSSGASGFSGSIGTVAEFDTIIKSADQSKFSDTTVAADDELQVTLNPNTTYVVEAIIRTDEVSGSGNMDFKYGFTGTADSVSLNSIWNRESASPTIAHQTSFPGSETFLSLVSSTDNILRTKGIIKVGSSGGVLSFDWAQNSSSGETKVFANSYLQVRQSDGAASGASGFSGQSGFSGTYSGFSGQSGTSGFSGDIIAVAKFQSVIKPSSTARSSTTTVTDDPHLSVSLDTGKTYYVKAVLPYLTFSTGLKILFNYSGTSSDAFFAYTNAESDETDTQTNFTVPLTFGLSTAVTNVITVDGWITTTSVGTLSVQWAQSTSVGSDVTLVADALLVIREGDGAASGFSGSSGVIGFSGTSGASGASGTSGVSGLGVSGFSGASGTSGFSGASGTSGYSGAFSGISGFSGASGQSGVSGFSGVGGTLDDAYDHGGPGAGRKIDTDSGAVVMSGFSGDNALEVLGHFKFLKDNASDIGATGDERPKTIYAGTSVVVGDTVTITTDRISSDNMSVGLGSGFSGARVGAVEGDLTYDNAEGKLRLQTDSKSVTIGQSVQYLNAWVTSDNPIVTIGTLPANSVTTGVILSVFEGFSSFSGIAGFSGFGSYSGFSGFTVGKAGDSEFFALNHSVESPGNKGVVLGSGFGFVDAETEVIATYSGFSGYSATNGKLNVTLTYAQSEPAP